MSSGAFVYTGRENLEAMTAAANYNRFLISLILSQRTGKEHERILDFGAGTGTYAKMLREHGVEPECLDPDKELQRELKRDGFTVVDTDRPLPANAYDLIYALNVFEHIEDDIAEAKKLGAALKRGGRLIIYVPAYPILFSAMDKLVGHYRRYRIDRLNELATAAGLRVKILSYYDPAGFWAALLYKTLGGKGVLSQSSVKFYDRYVFPVSRAVNPLTRKLLGKNVFLVAEKI